MRDLYQITYNEDDNYKVISQLDLEDCDYTKLFKSEPVDDDFISELSDIYIKFSEDGNLLPDYLSNVYSVPILSERLLDILRKLNVRFQSIRAKTSDGLYYYCNFLSAFDCLDENKSITLKNEDGTIRKILRVAIDESRVPKDIHAFKVIGRMTDVVVDDEFVNSSSEKRISGIAFIKL